jgi:hypothetical protein
VRPGGCKIADAGIGEVALVALAAASTAYTISQSGNTPNEPTQPNMPKTAASPDVNIATQTQIAQQQAQSVAGTSNSANPGEGGGISNDPLAPRKTLLGV